MGSSNSPVSSLFEADWDVDVVFVGNFAKGCLEIALI
jgi:hypothetical protein